MAERVVHEDWCMANSAIAGRPCDCGAVPRPPEPYRREQVDELVRAARAVRVYLDETADEDNDNFRAGLMLDAALKPFPDPEPEGEGEADAR